MRKKQLVNILISVLPSIQIPLSDPPQSETFHPNATMDTRKQNLYSPDLLKTATTATKDFLAFQWAKLPTQQRQIPSPASPARLLHLVISQRQGPTFLHRR